MKLRDLLIQDTIPPQTWLLYDWDENYEAVILTKSCGQIETDVLSNRNRIRLEWIEFNNEDTVNMLLEKALKECVVRNVAIQTDNIERAIAIASTQMLIKDVPLDKILHNRNDIPSDYQMLAERCEFLPEHTVLCIPEPTFFGVFCHDNSNRFAALLNSGNVQVIRIGK